MRLIDAEALKKVFEETVCIEPMPYAFVKQIIDNAPTVEENSIIDGLNNEIDDLSENLAWYINERNRLLKERRPQSEWIPVSERLPEDMQSVLIWFEYYRYGYYEDGYFNCMYQTYGFGYVCDGKWSPFINGITGWRDYNVIAWQPLPEPYQKGGEDDG